MCGTKSSKIGIDIEIRLVLYKYFCNFDKVSPSVGERKNGGGMNKSHFGAGPFHSKMVYEIADGFGLNKGGMAECNVKNRPVNENLWK